MKMFLFFSHKLTPEQIEDAKRFGIDEFIYMPENLQKIFSNIDPEIDIEDIEVLIKEKFGKFLIENANSGDYVLIQGDFGVVYHLVNFCKSVGLVPVYATTKREVREIEKDGKIQKISEFRHIKFRKY